MLSNDWLLVAKNRIVLLHVDSILYPLFVHTHTHSTNQLSMDLKNKMPIFAIILLIISIIISANWFVFNSTIF